MMQDKDLDKIVSAYALASSKFPNSIDYDLITVARELVEGRDLSRYSKKNDFIYYQDGENVSVRFSFFLRTFYDCCASLDLTHVPKAM